MFFLKKKEIDLKTLKKKTKKQTETKTKRQIHQFK